VAPNAQPFVALILGTALLAWLGVPAAVRAQEDVDVDRPRPLLDRWWPEIREARAGLTPFLRDTALTLRLRTNSVEAQTITGMQREGLAGGGWLAYRSGWLLNGFQIGATFYGAAPLYAPADKDSLLLAPGQNDYYVLGEAFAALRYQEYALLKGYRQLMQQPYINRQDNRMTPNTFEGVTLGGKAGAVQYLAAYLTRIKTRNADQFVPMSEAAGAPRSNYGVALFGVTLQPLPGLSVVVSEQYGVNTFNTFFGQVEHVSAVGPDLRLQLGAQFTDQRAVGAALVATTQVNKWVTRNGSARVALTYRQLTLKGGASVTASGNRTQSPWGYYPGYLLLLQQSFNNAAEKAWLAGVAYDFSAAIIPGLTAFANLAWGVDSIISATRARLPDEAEYDLTVDYRPPAIQGLVLRLRGALYDQDGADRLSYGLRFIVNWEIPIL
jgi:outer membrane OprD family porin